MSDRTLTPGARVLMSMIPPFYEREPFMEGIASAEGAEFTRLETDGRLLQRMVFPQNATDLWRLLAFWETQLGLPVEPAHDSVSVRSRRVMSAIRGRAAFSEIDWFATLSQALGTTGWTYTVSGLTVTIHVPLVETSSAAVQFERLARNATPAHLALLFSYGEGFLLDFSELDTDAL